MHFGQKIISQSSPTFIIAEMSANHNGDFEKAIEIIRVAKECGADAIKLQTYRADTITLDCNRDDFLIPSESPWEKHRTLFSLYEKAHTPWEWHEALFQEAIKQGIEIFSSPFDTTAVDFLENLGVIAYKVASPEITDIPLLKKIASTQKPIILSTGVAELEDISLAVQTLRQEGCSDIILLKCTTAYPAPPEEINLRTITHMAETFECLTGISDHTLGIGIPVAAVALGAKVIEKHFVLDNTENSVDAFFSLDPSGFKEMVDEIRKVEKALGKVTYDLTESARKNIRGRRSLYISKSILAGECLTLDHIKSVRPGFGLHPKYQETIIGESVNQDLKRGDRLSWDVIGSPKRKLS